MNNQTRAALLINSQSPNTQYLPGAPKDTLTMRRFLLSPIGGAFYDWEIHVLENPTCAEVLIKVNELNVDYLVVHVSTHGFTTHSLDRRICLTDGNISSKQLLNNSKRELVLVDACCNIIKSGRIGNIQWPREEYINFIGGNWARNYFDKCLASLPEGKMIVYGAQLDHSAYEDRNGEGGQFTLSLMETLEWCQQSRQEGYYTIDQVLPYVEAMLDNQGNDQKPEIAFRTGNFTAPIGIISPRFIYPNKKMIMIPQTMPQNDNGAKTFLLMGSLLFAGYLLSD